MPRQDRQQIREKGRPGRKPGNGGGRKEGMGHAHNLLPTPVPESCHKLTLLEAKFVIEYMTDCNATEAARRAGYKARLDIMAQQLLNRPRVRQALAIQLHARSERTQITADRVITEIGRIAFADIRGMFKPDGSLKEIPEMTAEQAALIESLDIDELYDGKDEDGNAKWIGRTKKAKLYNKLKSLETLAKHLGVLSDRNFFDFRTQNIQNNTQQNTIVHAVLPDLGVISTEQLEQLHAIATSLQQPGKGIIDTTGTVDGTPRH